MKIAVIVAMDKELELLLAIMPGYEVRDVDGLRIYAGNVGENEVVAMKCGIGKVNSALNTLRLIQREAPQLVINSGVAGGTRGTSQIGSVVVADNITYHDVWCGSGTQYGAADGLPVFMKPSPEILRKALEKCGDEVRFGLICSGDIFVSEGEEVRHIKEKFPDVMAVDMESASIAQTCILNSVPFAVIRVVSDTPGEGENISQYTNFWKEAPEKTFHVVRKILE